MTRKLLLGFAAALMVLVTAGGSASNAQNAPAPPPAPQVAPDPSGPPEAPEPPEPPEPPDSTQFFVLNDGSVHLGVTLGDVSAQKAQELKLPAVAGALVNSVQKNSAAARAGLESGDAIIEFDGIRVRSSAELRRLIRETPADRTVAIKIVRQGKTSVLSAKLEASRGQFNYNYNFQGPDLRMPPIELPDLPNLPGGHRATLGISADDLTPQLAGYFGVNEGAGVLVSEVTKGGAADKAGLKAGDVIVQVDGKPVSRVEELRDALNDNFTGDTRKVSLTIVRDHHEQTVSAELTRSHIIQRRTSNLAAPKPGVDLSQLPEQLEQLRAQGDQVDALSDGQRTMIQIKVKDQQKALNGEWQQQLQQQMHSLQDQLKPLKEVHVVVTDDGKI